MQLTATTKSLKAVLGAAADPNVQFTTCYHDIDQNGKVTYGHTSIVGNGTTEVTLAAAPGEVTARIIDSIHINNADNTNATPEVFIDDGTTNWILFKATLATLEVASWTPGSGWKVLEADGGLKQQVA